jgi:hypothetical protein
VRQHRLGEQLRRRGVGDVEHAEVGRASLVREIQVAAATPFEQGDALAAVAVAAQVVPAQVPHPTAFRRVLGLRVLGLWMFGPVVLGPWVHGHPSVGRGLGGVPYARRAWLIRLIIYRAAVTVISDTRPRGHAGAAGR